MSKGIEIIGTFNSENLTAVDRIKQKAIDLVDLIEYLGIDSRRKSMAISNIEIGTMLAVKSLF